MAKGTTEDEMAGWHHELDGREFEWTLGDGDGQGGLVCCDSWGHKELDTTGRLNWTELNVAKWSFPKNITRILLHFLLLSCFVNLPSLLWVRILFDNERIVRILLGNAKAIRSDWCVQNSVRSWVVLEKVHIDLGIKFPPVRLNVGELTHLGS